MDNGQKDKSDQSCHDLGVGTAPARLAHQTLCGEGLAGETGLSHDQ